MRVQRIEGTLVYHPDQPDELAELVWLDRSGARLGTLGDPAAYQGLRFSPDGKRLAVGIVDSDTGRTDLWIYDVARGIRSRFTFDPLFERSPSWSADGAYLYFTSNRRGHFDIYRKALVGRGRGRGTMLESGPC
jgi:dipeptidyl aminopeptidase/acylaminoacyl peptidase